MFLIVYYLIVSALAAKCSESQTNCATDMCETVGTILVCTQCKTEGQVPINGACTAHNDDKVTGAGCKKKDGNANVDGTDKVCGQCTSANYFLYKGGCYKKGEEPGSTICKDATGTTGICDECQAGYFKNPSAATDKTKDSCVACGDDNCATCAVTGTGKCSKCKTTGDKTYLKGDAGAGTCVTEVECTANNDHYIDNTDSGPNGKTCKACADGTFANCKTCTKAATTVTCTACKENMVFGLGKKSCVPKCPDNSEAKAENTCTCKDGFKPNEEGTQCIAGDAPKPCTTPDCKACTNPKTANEICTACNDGTYLTPTGQCIDKCSKLGSYYGTTDNKCKECTVANCAECDTDGSCQTCRTGFYPDANECKACDSSCKSCSGATANDCTECPSGKALKYGNDGTKGTCGEGCVVNTAQSPGNCKTCDLMVDGTKYCSACSVDSEYPQNGVCSSATARTAATCKTNSVSSGACTSCNNGFFLMEGGCYETGKYPGKSVCTQVATGGNTCKTPAPGYNMDGGNLVTCPKGCKTCSDAKTCTVCMDGYVLTNNACSKCDASCLTCETGASTCTACASGYYKVGSATGPCTSCETDNGSVTGVKGCLSCAAPSSNTGPVLCYLMKDSAAGGSDPNLSPGAIAGISVAVIVIVGGLVGFLCWWFICRGKA